MPTMGKYCKAYPIDQFRQYPGWSEKTENLRPEKTTIDGSEVVAPRDLTDSFLYLQENYIVTDGIFLDQHVIFDAVTPEWIAYCKEQLHFEIPAYATSEAQPASE